MAFQSKFWVPRLTYPIPTPASVRGGPVGPVPNGVVRVTQGILDHSSVRGKDEKPPPLETKT